ncbi:PEP-CTERM sorting domain-containing protein [Neptunomonas sp.]|uniref:PEP-CTERM sorting domain-containing protein n=1 Tax=Neptunomonas sp. TaxID=1971898 RepID=UPI00356A9176
MAKQNLVIKFSKTKSIYIIAVLLLALGGTVQALPMYNIYDLGTLSGADTSLGYSVNNSGQVAGALITQNVFHHAFIGDKNGLVDLGTLGRQTSSASYINNKGQVVGYMGNIFVNDQSNVFIGDKNGILDLGNLGGYYARPTGINDNGVIVGYKSTDSSPSFSFIGDKNGLAPIDTGSSQFQAVAINNSDQVAGSSNQPGVDRRYQGAAIYDGNEIAYLDDLAGFNRGSRANSINNNGQVVGHVNENNSRSAFIGDANGLTDLGTLLGANFSQANGISDNGIVVGFSGSPYIWDKDSGIHSLSDFVSDLSGWNQLRGVSDISDNGNYITGWGYTKNSETHAYLLERATPVVEPKIPTSDSPELETITRAPEFFGPKEKVPLPLGQLKIWDTESGSYVLLSGEDGKGGESLFDHKKQTEVLVHGWNGESGNNTPLEDKWIAQKGGFTEALVENTRIESNILAFDWTEAANSRLTARSNLTKDELKITTDELNALLIAEATNSPLDDRYSHISHLYGTAIPTLNKWDLILDDKWVPNQQVSKQGAELAQQLKPYLRMENSGDVAFYGHSLGAGVSTYAVSDLIGLDLGDKVSSLTLFDPPEDKWSDRTSGNVNLASKLQSIKENSFRLPIDNYWSSNPGGISGGYGQAYSYAANIETTDNVHGEVPVPVYSSTIRYNTDPDSLVSGTLGIGGYISFDVPEGIGYDDVTGSITLARQGTNCTINGHLNNPFAFGLDNCKKNGFNTVIDNKLTKLKVAVDFKAFLGSEAAKVELASDTGLPTMSTGSSVYAYTDFFVPTNAVGLELDLEWLIGFLEDDLMIWLDNTLIYSADFENLTSDFFSTGLLSLAGWEDQRVTLTLGVLSDFEGSTVKVNDIRLALNDVPEPPTLALMFFGLITMIHRSRKYKAQLNNNHRHGEA